MKSNRQSDIYSVNLFFWNSFGLWPGKTFKTFYIFYAILFSTFLTVIYNVLLVVNLIYTPRNVEALVQEVIYFFTEITVLSKISMTLFKRKKILAMFELIDCEEFQGSDKMGREMVEKSNSIYKLFWKLYAFVSNFAYGTLVASPLILHFTINTDLELPIAKYYFFSSDFVEKHLSFFFVYQCFGMYIHMWYNVNADSFIAGLIFTGITQLKLLNYNFSQLKLDSDANSDAKSKILELNKLLRHYDLIVK